ncbi:MAG: hypothetical protein K6T91_00345 [Firmicutes bacterium]|nr:hypothetical protein [Bacillota bacterium]
MAPRSKRKQSSRNKPPFKLKEIMLYGLPVWTGAVLAGWYFWGWSGLWSTTIGLALLAAYILSEVGFVKLSDKYLRKSPRAMVAIAAAGFPIRLIGLWFLVYLISHIVRPNWLIALTTLAFGFTVMLAISMKSWLKD